MHYSGRGGVVNVGRGKLGDLGVRSEDGDVGTDRDRSRIRVDEEELRKRQDGPKESDAKPEDPIRNGGRDSGDDPAPDTPPAIPLTSTPPPDVPSTRLPTIEISPDIAASTEVASTNAVTSSSPALASPTTNVSPTSVTQQPVTSSLVGLPTASPSLTAPTIVAAPTFLDSPVQPGLTASPERGPPEGGLLSSQLPPQAALPTIVSSLIDPVRSDNGVNSKTIISSAIGASTSNSQTLLLTTINASLAPIPTDPTAVAVAETQAPNAQITPATAIGGKVDGDSIGKTETGSSPTESAGKGSLNVTETNKSTSSASTTTIAISISVIVAGTVALSIVAYFLIRRHLRKRRLHSSARAESPPVSPLLSKFDPMPSSPLPTSSVTGRGEGGLNSQMSIVEWGSKGKNRFGNGNERERRNGLSRYGAPVIPLPRLPNRDTLRVFPNAREKLGGKQLPKDF